MVILCKEKQALIMLDDVTRHNQNVSNLAGIIAENMELNDLDCRIVKCAAAYHDIGKGFVKQNTLCKSDILTASEKKEVQKHARLGANYMRKNKHLKHYADFVLFHHENYNGTGYFGVHGEKTPLVSRIIRIADYFDALCVDRPYRKAYTISEALKIMEKDSSAFDPRIFELFITFFTKNSDVGWRIKAIYENINALI